MKKVQRWATALMLCGGVALVGACGDSDDDAGGSGTSDATSTVSATAELQAAQPGWRTGTPAARKVAFADADNSEKVRIALFQAGVANSYWAQHTAAIEEVAAARNAEVKVFDATFDAAKQQSQIQDALTTNQYDAFVIVPANNTNLIPMVARAESRGVPVISTGDFPIGPRFDTVEPQVPGIVGVANTSNKTNGEAWAEMVTEACEGVDPCEVALMPGLVDSALEAALYDTFKEGIASQTNIKIVAREPAGYLLGPARSAMRTILTAHPGLDVLQTSGDQMATGAELAAKQAGKDVKIIGNSVSYEGAEAVKDGRWFGSTVQLPYDGGLYAADMALRAARDQPFEASVDPTVAAGMPKPALSSLFTEFPDFAGQYPVS